MKKMIFLYLMLNMIICGQESIYKTDKYEVFKDGVKEGKYEVKAISDKEIRSNYIEAFTENMSNELRFKFSLNGEDNERPSGFDHVVYLKSGVVNEIPLIKFGENTKEIFLDKKQKFIKQQNLKVKFQLDLRGVTKDLIKNGYYETFSGSRINEGDLEGVYLFGSMSPLNWDFGKPTKLKSQKLRDRNGDGIYTIEIEIPFKPIKPIENGKGIWKLQQDISEFPKYVSNMKLLEALYNMSLEEMLLDIRDDGAFMAGAKWTGVWTRDISYSILLSLAVINPDACKTSLMAKVKNDIIIQDTGTGGSWPVSTDRMTWVLAAYEVYKVTGDKAWLKKIYEIIKNSVEADIAVCFDPETGLAYGESSFLDWREQTYPRWMESKDIYQSQCLGTNIVHYQTFKILGDISKILGYDAEKYISIAEGLKKSINKYLWNEEKGYYSQFVYGRSSYSVSEKSEALGEALAVLFNVADENQIKSISENTHVINYGIPCIYPQIPNIPPYHNDGIWPFVEAYWTWASAKAGNEEATLHSLSALQRAAGLFLTNKENFVAQTGDAKGTEINSDRQLWSVAGMLSSVYRVIFGMEFQNDKLSFSPFVLEEYKGEHHLKNFKYREAILDIELHGYGNKIEKFMIDGKVAIENSVNGSFTGKHKVDIYLVYEKSNLKLNLVKNQYSPETPNVKLENNQLFWDKVDKAEFYNIYKNGVFIKKHKELSFKIDMNDEKASSYQIESVDNNSNVSFLSEPVLISPISLDFQPIGKLSREERGFTNDGYVEITRENTDCSFDIDIPKSGNYLINISYSNGSGPVNTDNKAAIRDLMRKNKKIGTMVFPQRGVGEWSNWGTSNSVKVYLERENHDLRLIFHKSNENMNGYVNKAFIDKINLMFLD